MSKRKKRARVRLTALVIAVLAAAALVESPVLALTNSSARSIVLNMLAGGDRQRLADLRIVNVGLEHYEQLNEYVVPVKVLDTRSGKTHIVTLGRGQRSVDTAQMDAAELGAYNARYGKLDKTLFNRLASLAPTDLVAVNIWLKQEPGGPIERPVPYSDPTEADLEGLLAANQRVIEAATARQVDPVKSRIEAMGYQVVGDSISTLLQATMSVADIRTVGGFDETDRIFPELPGNDEMDVARPTIRANFAPASNYTGVGITVAQVEYSNAQVATDNPFLGKIIQDPEASCSQKADHATLVAGIISSSNANFKGIAPGAKNFATGSCGGTDAAIWTALKGRSLEAVEERDARAVNLSWGIDTINTMGDKDKWYDDLVFKLWPTVVKAAGNLAGGIAKGCAGSSGNISSPGLGYNVITVGASDDKGTSSLTVPTKDGMYICSSFKNPKSAKNDRQKPDLVAPGTTITSTGTSGGTNPAWLATNSGTSFAAPIVTGAAAVLMDVDSSLAAWPESIRAILQATAWFRTDGTGTGFKDKDGAGLLQLDRAVASAEGANGVGFAGWGGEYYNCNADDKVEFANLYLNKGKRARVAIAWPTNPAYNSYYTKPSADLDLYIYRNGAAIAWGTSYDNTSELVDFVPTVSGTYKLYISTGRCDLAPGSVGWGWYTD